MKKIFYSSLFLITLFSASCTLQDHVLPGEPDVYVSGAEQTDTTFTAKYWKNGQSVELMTSKRYLEASAIAVSGSDVYAVGFENDPTNAPVGKYWKNGMLEDFSKDISAGMLSDVEVSGGDVYVAGVGFDGPDYFGAYWKNGVSVKLPGNSKWAKDITVVGNDVYVAGMSYNGTHQEATYWKNGVATNLTDGTNDSFATAIAVWGNEIYVVGYENVNSLTVSRYWKNGVELGITANKTYSESTDITVSANGVYISAFEAGVAFYWHNNVQSLNGGAYTSGIKVWDNDIYISGGIPGNKSIAKYWKNGVEVFLSDDTNYAFTTSIVVTNP